MSKNEIELLPKEIAIKSISKNEIVLPYKEALIAVDILEQKGVHILGWEGWIKTKDGRIGHGNAPIGTESLQNLSLSDAARFCRETIKEDYNEWCLRNAGAEEQVHFCFTVRT